MNENAREQRQDSRGRTFLAKVKGDSIDQLEIRALEQAAEFFGAGIPLEVDTGYEATHRDGLAVDGEGRYFAMVIVLPAEDATP